jgi:hypothetical protein
MKYQRRAVFRQFRKAGFPFMVSHRLAKLALRFASIDEYSAELVKEGCRVELLTFCKCCGPETIRLTTASDKEFDISWYTRLPSR